MKRKPNWDLESESESDSDSGQDFDSGRIPGSGRGKRVHFPGVDLDHEDCESCGERDEEEEEGRLSRPHDCSICGRIVTSHCTSYCPYLKKLPHDAILPPGVDRFCKCCGLKDGHPGTTDWKGYARMRDCHFCGKIFDHWPDECPTTSDDDDDTNKYNPK